MKNRVICILFSQKMNQNNNYDNHHRLGLLSFKQGDIEQAVFHLEQAIKLAPSNPEPYKVFAKITLSQGKILEALKLFEQVLTIDSSDYDNWLSAGLILDAIGRYKDAELYFRKAIELAPGNDEANKALISLFSKRQAVSIDTLKNTPLVSIIIPLYNNIKLTHKCVKAILENTDYPNYEIILLDNASSDGTTDYLKRLTSNKIRAIFNSSNIGFVEACNKGAQAAFGKYYLFLNNDTEVQHGWLTALMSLAESTLNCGAVGAKLVYPNGTLQEAGGIIFSDGNGWNYGRGLWPDDPRFNFIREVDYCSGAALMVKKELWDKIGGFDVRFSPAYYEDADLCFEVRKHGYKVYYQPYSVVIHHEGQTAGVDPSMGFKRYQELNKPKFVEKWHGYLKNQSQNNPANVISASNRQAKMNVLVADPFLPMFDRAAGLCRLFQLLKLLKELQCHVTFIARDNFLETHYRPILENIGIEVYAGDPVALGATGKKIDGLIPFSHELLFQERAFHYAILETWELARYYLPLIRRFSPNTKIIVDSIDLHFVREMRAATLFLEQGHNENALKIKELELDTYNQADMVWVVTEQDKNVLKPLVQHMQVKVVPTIHVKVEENKSYENTSDLLFVGNFSHLPNVDGIQYFCKEIFPLILRKLPNIKLNIVGSSPSNAIRVLANENVVVTGYVEDLSCYLRKARVSISPLRYGSGMKGKIGEALSWGLPVITTSIGAEGMGLRDGQDVLIADEPMLFADKVVSLYNDPQLWQMLSKNGKGKVEQNWLPAAVKSILNEIFFNKVTV